MPHIPLPPRLPGITGLLAARPDTAGPLMALAETLLRGPSPLGRGERELIAAYVSELNGCRYCADSHGAFAAAQLPDGDAVVAAVLADPVRADPAAAPVDARLRALLAVAAEVRGEVRAVSDEAIAAARAAGAGDTEIHDTVLIAAAFCMYNRYVNGLATALPEDPGHHRASAERIVAHGYAAPRPGAPAASATSGTSGAAREEGGEPACALPRVCTECGRLTPDSDARFCPRCGEQLPTAAAM